jgi:hypothetical protein
VLTASEALARPSLEKAPVELDADRFRMCTKVQFKRLPWTLNRATVFTDGESGTGAGTGSGYRVRDEIEIGGIRIA